MVKITKPVWHHFHFFIAIQFYKSAIIFLQPSTSSAITSHIHSYIICQNAKFNALHKLQKFCWTRGQSNKSKTHMQFNAERDFPIITFENTHNSSNSCEYSVIDSFQSKQNNRITKIRKHSAALLYVMRERRPKWWTANEMSGQKISVLQFHNNKYDMLLMQQNIYFLSLSLFRFGFPWNDPDHV